MASVRNSPTPVAAFRPTRIRDSCRSFWQFPTVSMGLGPLNAIYQARFNQYLQNRGLADTSQQKVYAFLGDGETDEVDAVGALSLAAREELDNLVFVVNCNLQRLDGPVRGNGKIIQELESLFRGAGWNVIKVVWGRAWDQLLAADRDGALVNLMNNTHDGDFQTYKAENGAFIRDHFFGRDPRTAKLVETWSDDQIWSLQRGGHDYRKMYAAYEAATKVKGQPTVILAKTIKGWTLGSHFEARNSTHQMKKLTVEDLKEFRDRLHIPIADSQLDEYLPPYYNPGPDNPASPVHARPTHDPWWFPAESTNDRTSAASTTGLHVRGSPTRIGQAAGGDNHGVRSTSEGTDPRRGHGRTLRPDHPRRGAHLRHGLVVPHIEDLRTERAAVRASVDRELLLSY